MNQFSPSSKKLLILSISILFVIFLFVFCPVASAKINPNSTLNITSINSHSITWEYNYTVLLTHASFDGVDIVNFDTKSQLYTASDLNPNSTHTFCIYSNTGINCESGRTQDIPNSNQEEFFKFIMVYIVFIAAIICCYLGLNIPFIGFGGLLFGLIGMATQLNGSLTNFILFLCVIIAGIFIGFEGGKN